MFSRCLIQIDVVSRREYAAVAIARRLRQRTRSAPGLDHNILGSVGLQDFVPSLHGFLVASYDLLNPFGEPRLQRWPVPDGIHPHIIPNPRIGLPLFWVAFVSSRMKVEVRE